MYHLTINVPTKELNLYPICDVQIGAHGFADRAYREYVRECAEDPVGMAFGGGDYTDGISPSNRKLLSAAYVRGEVYDTFMDMMKAGSDEQVAEFVRLTQPLAGKVPFWLKGHHMFQYVVRQRDGTHVLRTSDHDIADKLGGKFLGEPGPDKGSAMVTFRFPPARAGGTRPELKMYAMHGEGSGKTLSGPLNALETQMRGQTADIFFTAHHHKLVAARGAKLREDLNEPDTKLRATDSVLVGGGSWLRGFLLNETTYAEDGQMVPLALGAPIIRIKRQDDSSFRVRVEL